MATGGLRPVTAIYSTFLQRGYDQILHDVCYQKLPVVFVIDRAWIVGEDGATHNGLFDISFLRCIPHLVIMAPRDENELQHMLKTALHYECPVAIRYPRGSGFGVKLDDQLRVIEMGKAEVMREGRDLTLLAIGASVYPAMAAADRLHDEGIDACVVNCRFVKPLDTDMVCDLARAHKKIITIEENVLAGGFGSAVLEALAERGINDITIRRLGINDMFVEHGSQAIIRTKYRLDADSIAAAAREMVGVRQGIIARQG
jgi:1-deoxy-D-xylulose-5-phosphate synthase